MKEKICSRILLWGGHGHLVAFALAQNMFKLSASLDTFSPSGVSHVGGEDEMLLYLGLNEELSRRYQKGE